jgi:hypothetical protein
MEAFQNALPLSLFQILAVSDNGCSLTLNLKVRIIRK